MSTSNYILSWRIAVALAFGFLNGLQVTKNFIVSTRTLRPLFTCARSKSFNLVAIMFFGRGIARNILVAWAVIMSTAGLMAALCSALPQGMI
jgi:hypothetical protein